MAKDVKTDNLSIEERTVLALERQAKAYERMAGAQEDLADWFHGFDRKTWTEKLEWYLHEFYQIMKTKQVGGSISRPDRGYEREADEQK